MKALRPTSVAQAAARLVRDLTTSSPNLLVRLLDEQLSCTLRGAHLVAALTEGRVSSAQAHDAMRQVEHDGDQLRACLVAELGRVLTTPMDAEDLFRFSRSVDDVLDNLRDFVREVNLYQPLGLDFAHPLIGTVINSLDCLRPALGQIAARRGSTSSATLAARKAAGEMRRLYQQELATLFDEPVDGETLKRRELLRRLDVVGLRLGEAADALADGTLKRGR